MRKTRFAGSPTAAGWIKGWIYFAYTTHPVTFSLLLSVYQMNFYIFFFAMLCFSHAALFSERLCGEDAERLERFFESFFHQSSVGYSLYGKKPVVVEHLPQLSKCPVQFIPQLFFERFEYSTLGQGALCWKRHSDSYKSNQFAFFYSEKLHALIFVNKRAALRVISQNIDLFDKFLPEKRSSFEILQDLCDEDTFASIIFRHPILAGILYGYGRNNAIAFANASYIQRLSPSIKGEGEQHLLAFPSVGFMLISNGTNEEENERILGNFKSCRQSIQKKFQNKSYLKVFEEAYLSEQP